ncbi:hypothetical protein HET69_28975 [Streptomyces sp. CJ_13]|uniref:hypothetical protein n=1 Tax=unclassified Streptomyces TaxID=2593676 RepID=UPI000F3A8CE0|nr:MULTISPECIES: hypothetical protein [unclassified Streptomyces]AYV28905.1 hypothetical protein EES41_19540 [Streptomyces sp. ADI95-16]MBT1187911.1 hypothetical protein [Streptomyces sp. CJ_13]
MRSTRRTPRRTTLRTAAVVVGAAAVLAVPVGSAFADSSAGAGVGAPVAPVIVRLADGAVAKVYKTGPNRYEADIFAGSTKLDTLVSRGGGVAYGRSDGLRVVLQPNGGVTSWMEGGEKSRPKPKGVASVRVVMPDGRIAKLVGGAGGERAVISLPNGEVLGAIDLRHPSAVHDGWTYELVRDGERVKFVVIDGRGGGSGWVYDFGSGKPVEAYGAGAVPGSGVRG